MLTGCTVIARNYAPHARVLAESFHAHNSGSRFVTLVVDDPGRRLGRGEPFDALTTGDIGLPDDELHRMATMYETQGIVSALRSRLLRFLLTEGADPVLFLDADGCVYAELAPVAELVERHSIVLTPHSPEPQPLHGEMGPEQWVLRNGVMNGGFLGVGKGAERFLDWWAERTARHCIKEPRHALYYGQAWLTLVPAYFEHHVLRDRGCNVMGQNLDHRDVEWVGNVPRIDGGPLRYFHFAAKFDPERPDLFAPFQEVHPGFWPTLGERPGAARLCREYARRVLSAGYREAKESRPLFETMPGGTPIDPRMRRAYREALMSAEERGEPEPPNPFSHGQDRFLRSVEAYIEATSPGGALSSDEESGDKPAPAGATEGDVLRAELEWHRRAHADEYARRSVAERQAGALAELNERMLSSRSWRLTGPLRRVGSAIRSARGVRRH